MPTPLKFPPTVEIKRSIAAAMNAGIEIQSIEIHPRKITIHARSSGDDNSPKLSPYELWKLSEGRQTSRLKRSERESGALDDKTRG